MLAAVSWVIATIRCAPGGPLGSTYSNEFLRIRGWVHFHCVLAIQGRCAEKETPIYVMVHFRGEPADFNIADVIQEAQTSGRQEDSVPSSGMKAAATTAD